MRKIAGLICGLAVLGLAAVPAQAADYGAEPEEMMDAPAPASRFYLRGDVSFAWQRAMDADHYVIDAYGDRYSDETDFRELESTYSFGAGAGANLGHNLRADATLDVRRSADYYSVSDYPVNSNLSYVAADVRSTVLLANLYYDFARSSHFTPYVGAGIGVSFNKTEQVYAEDSHGYSYDFNGKNTTNFAWALMAGVSKDLGLAHLDVGYRYLNMGDANVDYIASCYTCGVDKVGAEIADMAAHEVRVGIRYKLH